MLKPKVGDMVTLKPQRVLWVGDGKCNVGTEETWTKYSVDAIASIEPRALQVGEQVRWHEKTSEGFVSWCGKIEAIQGNFAAVWIGACFRNARLSDLTRVEDKS